MTILEDRQQISVPLGRPSTTLEVLGARHPGFCEILTPAALDFVAKLQRRFGAARRELLTRRSATARPAVPKFGADDGRSQGRPELAGCPSGARSGGPAV